MELHKLDLKLELVSCGTVDEKIALRELSAISKNGSKKYENSDEAISETTFILSRSEEDFLRVESHSESEVHFSSDRLCYQEGWFKRLFANTAMRFCTSSESATQVIKNYLSMEREEFESLYEAGYSNAKAFNYVSI